MNNEQPNAVDPVAEGPEVTETALVPAPKKKKKGFFARFKRESKRDRQLAALNDGYEQLVNLISSIQMSLDVQAKNQQQLLSALEDLPEVADGLKKMGTAAERQTEVIRLMRDQLNSNVQRDQQISKNVSRINKTLAFTNLLFVLGIAAAIYVFMAHSEKPLLPAQDSVVPPAVEKPAESTPESEPAVLVAPTNELDACTEEAATNDVPACDAKPCTNTVEACTNTVEACTNTVEACTNIVDVCTNAPKVEADSVNTFTIMVNTDTNPPASN